MQPENGGKKLGMGEECNTWELRRYESHDSNLVQKLVHFRQMTDKFLFLYPLKTSNEFN